MEHTNYHLSSILTDSGYRLEKCGVVGEWNLTGDAGELYMKGKIQGGVFLKNGNDGTEYVMAGEKAIGIKRQGLLLLPDGNLPEQYGRLGFHRACLYRCYQKNRRRNPPKNRRTERWIYRMKNVSW